MLFIVVSAIALFAASSCGKRSPDSGGPVVNRESPVESCGAMQPSQRELLLQWFAVAQGENPDMAADLAKMAGMSSESVGLSNTGLQPQATPGASEPEPIFGMATITVTPGGRTAPETQEFVCNGLIIHAKVSSRVMIVRDGAATQAGFVNLDSGNDFIVLDGQASLSTRIKVEFPGNAVWEPIYGEFTLNERQHEDGGFKCHESCNLFVLGSGNRSEMGTRMDPDHSVLPSLLSLLASAPSPHTRANAAVYLGILKDPAAAQAMLDALKTETDDAVKARIAIGLGILGDDAAVVAIEEALGTVQNKEEHGWMFSEALNRLKGVRH